MVILLLKLLLAPTLVVASSSAGRRWGPAVTGTLVALPIVAGPILLVSTLLHGAAFGRGAASSSLLGLLSLALFVVVFARTARRHGWIMSLATGWAACLAVDLGLAQLRLAPAAALVLTLAGPTVAFRLMPSSAVSTRQAIVWPWWDLPGRAAATGLLVLAVTTASSSLGPSLTGVLAPFPVATSVVAAFVCAQAGPIAVQDTLTGVLRGLFGFAAFCFLVAVLLEPVGIAPAFGLGAVAAVLTQLAVRRLAMRRSDSEGVGSVA